MKTKTGKTESRYHQTISENRNPENGKVKNGPIYFANGKKACQFLACQYFAKRKTCTNFLVRFFYVKTKGGENKMRKMVITTKEMEEQGMHRKSISTDNPIEYFLKREIMVVWAEKQKFVPFMLFR